jgi:hypothetical protein
MLIFTPKKWGGGASEGYSTAFILVFLDATLCSVMGATCTSNMKSLHVSFTLNSSLITPYHFWRLFVTVNAEVNASKKDTDRVEEVLLQYSDLFVLSK